MTKHQTFRAAAKTARQTRTLASVRAMLAAYDVLCTDGDVATYPADTKLIDEHGIDAFPAYRFAVVGGWAGIGHDYVVRSR